MQLDMRPVLRRGIPQGRRLESRDRRSVIRAFSVLSNLLTNGPSWPNRFPRAACPREFCTVDDFVAVRCLNYPTINKQRHSSTKRGQVLKFRKDENRLFREMRVNGLGAGGAGVQIAPPRPSELTGYSGLWRVHESHCSRFCGCGVHQDSKYGRPF